MVSTDKKTYLDIHKASYIYFVKIFVSNFTAEGNSKVYEITEDEKMRILRENLYYTTNQEVCIRVAA